MIKMKKSEFSMMLVMMTFVTISGLVTIMALNIFNQESEKLAEDVACQTSLRTSSMNQKNTVEECKINYVTISKERLNKENIQSLLEMHTDSSRLGEEYYSKSYFEENSEIYKINKIISDEIARVWFLADNGKLNPFKKDGNTKYCLKGSLIRFNTKDFELNDLEIPLSMCNNPEDCNTKEDLNKNSLLYFLFFNPYKKNSDVSYYDHLYDEDVDIDYNAFQPFVTDNKISTDREYYVLYRKIYYKDYNKQRIQDIFTLGFAYALNLPAPIKSLTRAVTGANYLIDSIDRTRDIFLEKGFDNVIIIDSNKLQQELEKADPICDVFVN